MKITKNFSGMTSEMINAGLRGPMPLSFSRNRTEPEAK